MSDATNGQQPDPVIVEAVHNISNRFGALGLEQLIGLAQEELAEAKAALEQLAELDD